MLFFIIIRISIYVQSACFEDAPVVGPCHRGKKHSPIELFLAKCTCNLESPRASDRLASCNPHPCFFPEPLSEEELAHLVDERAMPLDRKVFLVGLAFQNDSFSLFNRLQDRCAEHLIF